MAFELHRDGFPGISASAIAEGQAVILASGGDLQSRVHGAASSNLEPFGVALAAASAPNQGVTVLEDRNVIKVPAGASLGHGAAVGVLPGTTSMGPVAAASGAVVWQVGRAMSAAAAGEIFSLYIRPRQLSGGA